MVRSLLTALSHSPRFKHLVVSLPPSRRFARRFVAGEHLNDAVSAIHQLNRRSLLATFDHLGENVHSADEAIAAAEEYVHLLHTIEWHGLRSNVSLKLTQLGLDIGGDLCLRNMRAILEQARHFGNFVRIDMEESVYTQRTLDIYFRLRAEGLENVGVVIQSYLYRSAGDVQRLAECGAKVRICKGAYAEPPNVAYPEKSEVDANFRRLVELMWHEEALAKGAVAAIATHDEKLIRWAKDEAQRRGIEREQFEFQMLYGIRRERQVQLATEGYRFRVYVPYGTQWFPYFMRRLAERPANVVFLLKNMFER